VKLFLPHVFVALMLCTSCHVHDAADDDLLVAKAWSMDVSILSPEQHAMEGIDRDTIIAERTVNALRAMLIERHVSSVDRPAIEPIAATYARSVGLDRGQMQDMFEHMTENLSMLIEYYQAGRDDIPAEMAPHIRMFPTVETAQNELSRMKEASSLETALFGPTAMLMYKTIVAAQTLAPEQLHVQPNEVAAWHDPFSLLTDDDIRILARMEKAKHIINREILTALEKGEVIIHDNSTRTQIVARLED